MPGIQFFSVVIVLFLDTQDVGCSKSTSFLLISFDVAFINLG